MVPGCDRGSATNRLYPGLGTAIEGLTAMTMKNTNASLATCLLCAVAVAGCLPSEVMAQTQVTSAGAHASVERDTGNEYFHGYDVPQDYATAFEWYRKAADDGDAEAMNNLGISFVFGLGVMRDYQAAVGYFKRSVDRGCVRAALNLGLLYESGKAGGPDYAAAMAWYRKAADGGSGAAKFSIGMLYEKGLGVPRNVIVAKSWYRAAGTDSSGFTGITAWGYFLAGNGGPPVHHPPVPGA
jgi:hypothetical protein